MQLTPSGQMYLTCIQQGFLTFPQILPRVKPEVAAALGAEYMANLVVEGIMPLEDIPYSVFEEVQEILGLAPPKLIGFRLEPTEATVEVGESIQIVAYRLYNNGSEEEIQFPELRIVVGQNSIVLNQDIVTAVSAGEAVIHGHGEVVVVTVTETSSPEPEPETPSEPDVPDSPDEETEDDSQEPDTPPEDD
ncbi:hypothetical protein [Shouchella clausii]|uniref:hypothetical protein n=1 Tax=Shouchella clausii TaxID=79880 RepID=UPI001C73906D|nr:hypothetical protein [Shouchella clausii]MBX0320218.1 hypothetical protein [Shouchella clausii]